MWKAKRLSPLLGLGLGLAPPLYAQSVAEVFQGARDAVVIVHTTQTEYPFLSTDSPVSVPGSGSGVLIPPNEVLTAAHVVQAANKVVVEFSSGRRINATVVASQPDHDVALLRLDEPASTRPVPIGDSDDVMVGDQVLVVGAPLGESHTLTVGHVSGRRTRRGLHFGGKDVDFIQTDAAINPGNSGGPMFNMRGEVIGIVSHILTVSGGSMGLGYAVSANQARASLLEGRGVWTGLESMPLTGGLAALLNIPPPGGGILVQKVALGSLAESLGLWPSTIPVAILDREILLGGDIILSVQGIPIGGELEGLERIGQVLQDLQPGETLTVTVLRGGNSVELSTRMR